MCRIHLQKGLTKQKVSRSSKEMSLRLRHVIMVVTLSSRLEIPRARFKEKNKVVNDGSALLTNSIHSHDEDNAQGQGFNIKAC